MTRRMCDHHTDPYAFCQQAVFQRNKESQASYISIVYRRTESQNRPSLEKGHSDDTGEMIWGGKSVLQLHTGIEWMKTLALNEKRKSVKTIVAPVPQWLAFCVRRNLHGT
jgi:hypothetical protein